ncbi:hypothetical protein EK21DRAFT_116485 [Setomelanomma holmii]|uniref:Uncharacterized protein n=1 Tax=Setomelanomma holmii TaxID=210430 RepID=A0A9P4H1A1_9PLEO|nr:hypothetical protein EK21DRAFT_116485 [Setomelanomma holmii]
MQSITANNKRRRASSSLLSPSAEAPAKKSKLAPEPTDTDVHDATLDVVQEKPVKPVVPGEEDEGDTLMDDDAPAVKTPKGKSKAKATSKNPPITEQFLPWQHNIQIPPKNAFWGIKPITGDPRPHPDQPSARDSNGATNPPMWEDRKFRFKRGSRYVKHFGPGEPLNAENLPDLDQEDLLAITLIDMRPVLKKDPTYPAPRRQPFVYCYDHGVPKDWNNVQAVKGLNDRRGQSINRITLDDPWTKIEREYLAALLTDFPDVSIWELTEKHNDRFMNEDFAATTAFDFSEQSQGRTVESVRHEYVTYKAFYDNGETPTGVRWHTEKSKKGRALHAEKKMQQVFGLPDKKLEDAHDVAQDKAIDDEDGTPKQSAKAVKEATLKKLASQKVKFTMKPKKSLKKYDNEGELDNAPKVPMGEQPKLGGLLELAGAYHPDEVRHSPPHDIPPRSPLSFSDSPLTELGGWTPRSPSLASEDGLTETAVEQAVKDTVDELVDTAVQPAPSFGLGIEIPDSNESQLTTPIEDTQDTKVEHQDAIIQTAQTTVETTTTPTDVDVEVVTSTQETHTQDTSSTIYAIPAPLHATRHVELDEEYDDDDEEL